MSDLSRLEQCRAQNLCCAQTLVQMGLWAHGDENAQMVQAVKGLCGGMRCGHACGALTGAICMLGLFHDDTAEMVQELIDWFCEEYGSMQCLEILDGDMNNRHHVCRDLIEKTYLFSRDLLQDYGYELLVEEE